uniref:uncharacterized protein LOC105350814 n=1 Tax=Fragaria vesca subsp. vesca TaxID=101020 RepID=UPI0005C9431C|nr:PREDICTED: uncharacterized protein LOC105350814 [Fragaria vesca subsp. vesca]
MRWHGVTRKNDDTLRHPADGEAWKSFDRSFPDFAADIRNVRLGLATDGFNPTGNMNLSYRKCLDVYMRPLIDELKELWENDVPTFDWYSQTSFRMKATVIWTISDFPRYGMLSSQTTKGYKAWPICLGDLNASWHARKVCYLGSRTGLPEDHLWRFDAASFDEKQEFGLKPQERSDEWILDMLNSFDFGRLSSDPDVLARNPKRPSRLENWTHKIFGFKDKTKDTVKARRDLQLMNIRPHLWLTTLGSMPLAHYRINLANEKKVFKWFEAIKYPHGYAGNISRCVKAGENKLFGLKTHDCHIMLQRLFPVVIRPCLHPDVVEPLVAVSRFFRKLCARELKKSDVHGLKEDIVYIMCKLERIFPPAFFDIMIHLMIHLLEQALLIGPVHYTWMFPQESNTTEAESSTNVFNLSIVSEVVRSFCNLPNSYKLTKAELREAHWCVLDHYSEVDYYKKKHLELIIARQPYRAEEMHKRFFPNYFLNWIEELLRENSTDYSQELHNLACKLQHHSVHGGCFVNGVKFVTFYRDEEWATQNYGVMVDGDEICYYGIILSVVELLYGAGMPVVLFKCKWFNTDPSLPRSTKMDHGFLSVNTSTSWYESELFILATMAKQVFYLDDPKEGGDWKVVNVMSHRNIWSASTLEGDAEGACDEEEAPEPYQEELSSYIPDTQTIRINNDPHYVHGNAFITIPGSQVPHVDNEEDEDENDDEETHYEEDEEEEEDEEDDDTEDEDYDVNDV